MISVLLRNNHTADYQPFSTLMNISVTRFEVEADLNFSAYRHHITVEGHINSIKFEHKYTVAEYAVIKLDDGVAIIFAQEE